MQPTMTQQITIYGTAWCGDCRRALRVLDQERWPYRYVDIEFNDDARAYVEEVNRGYRSVPTIVFPDGTVMVEPSSSSLLQKLAALQDLAGAPRS